MPYLSFRTRELCSGTCGWSYFPPSTYSSFTDAIYAALELFSFPEDSVYEDMSDDDDWSFIDISQRGIFVSPRTFVPYFSSVSDDFVEWHSLYDIQFEEYWTYVHGPDPVSHPDTRTPEFCLLSDAPISELSDDETAELDDDHAAFMAEVEQQRQLAIYRASLPFARLSCVAT